MLPEREGGLASWYEIGNEVSGHRVPRVKTLYLLEREVGGGGYACSRARTKASLVEKRSRSPPPSPTNVADVLGAREKGGRRVFRRALAAS